MNNKRKPEIYLDYAATSRHKPEEVRKAITSYFMNIGASPGRGGYQSSIKAGRILINTRKLLSELFNAPTIEQVIFTPGVTFSLNYVIKGLLSNNSHVITTTMEHNSVLRPLKSREANNEITVDYITANDKGQIEVDSIENAVKDNTEMIIITHASNVTGTLQELEKIANIAQKYNLYYVIDAAQTAGVYNLDFQKLNLDILAFTGHKYLMGPPGTGGMVISKRAAQNMNPLIEGGTGSESDKEYQPDFLPDKFESGTINTPALAGLQAGIEKLIDLGPHNIKKHLNKLTSSFIEELSNLPQITIHGPQNPQKQTATISITVKDYDLGRLSMELDQKHGIMTRSGLHCAPLAHKSIGTFPEGTLRFSFGYYTALKDIEFAVNALKSLITN